MYKRRKKNKPKYTKNKEKKNRQNNKKRTTRNGQAKTEDKLIKISTGIAFFFLLPFKMT